MDGVEASVTVWLVTEEAEERSPRMYTGSAVLTPTFLLFCGIRGGVIPVGIAEVVGELSVAEREERGEFGEPNCLFESLFPFLQASSSSMS